MISLQPINKRIRETLHKKSQAVSRDFTGTELDPIDQIRETYAKTTWVKMYSPVDNSEAGGLNTVSIVNGILDNQTDDGIQSMFSGFDSLYRQGEDGGGPLAPQKSETVKTHRPIPGIKDVTIDYEGGLAAIRKATINWTCWTFEDIDALQCHFMAHGKGVLLEWGWSVPTSTNELLVNEEDMKNGRAYTLIQDKVIANAGNYDAMAGVISNWEWSLRDDGGFDITTTLVSRGVNILKGDTSPPGTKVVNDEGIVQPPLHIFVGGLRETLFDLTLEGATWFDATKHKPLSEWNGSWETGSVKQPPGILSWAADNIFSNISAGPWVTWGWLEDNILSRFLGLVQKNGKPISSFRSIEPVLSDDGSGQYIPNSGDPVDNPYQAKFRSVIIRNNEWLRTPSFNRWILPGQFPAGKLAESMFEGWTADYGDFIMKVCKGAFSDGGEVGETYFRNFAVDPNDLNKGGYLRNILISYDLIEEAFLDATNVREGMSNLFDEFNKDLDGYWNFEIVSDSQNPGNIKVVDMNKTLMTVSELIDRRGEGNPDSPLFIFPSWGEKSIVKNQSLNSKVPSAMAVTAMYAGTSKEGHEEAATPAGQALAAVTAAKSAIDQSQKQIKHATRVGEKEPFGSISPYGDSADGVYYKSDERKDTAIPSGETFGHNKGVAFKLDREALIKYYKDQIKDKSKKAADASDAEKKAAQEAAKVTAAIAKEQASTDKSRKMFEDMIESPAGVTSEEKSKYWPWNWADKVTFSLYNREGDLEEVPEYHVFIRETMIDYIHGNTVPIGKEGKEDKAKILAETVPDPGIALELEITIDGTGGIIPGNCFQVDYIPETFKKFVVFQAIKVGHSISSDNWTTTISGPMRVAMDRIKKED